MLCAGQHCQVVQCIVILPLTITYELVCHTQMLQKPCDFFKLADKNEVP